MTLSSTLLSRLGSPFESPTAGRLALAGIVAGAIALSAASAHLSETATLVAYAALFAPYAILLFGMRETELSGWLLLAAALVVRFAFVPLDPLLSDDLYRYVWDGRVALSGINPFEHAPAAEALASVRDAEIWPKINHPDVPTIYPPGAQYLFALNALVGAGLVGMKTLFILVEAACIGGCFLYMKPEGIDPRRPFAIYALNPLVFVEIGWSGHVDVVAWALLAVAIVAWRYGDGLAAAVVAALSAGASIAVKFLGLLALPLFAAGRDSRLRDSLSLRGRLGVLLLAPLVVAASYLPFLGAGSQLFAGFGEYAESWRGNDGGYRAVWNLSESSLRDAAGGGEATDGEQVLIRLDALDGLYRSLGWTKRWQGETIPDTTYATGELAALVAKTVALFVLGLALLWRLIARAPVAESLTFLLLTLYFLAPIVHPWYVAWLVPLAALSRSRAALLFSFTCLAAYFAWLSALKGGPWRVPTWAVVLEYGSVGLLAFYEAVRRPTAPRSPDSEPTTESNLTH